MNRYHFLTQLFTPVQRSALSKVSNHLLSNPGAVDTHKLSGKRPTLIIVDDMDSPPQIKDRPSYVR